MADEKALTPSVLGRASQELRGFARLFQAVDVVAKAFEEAGGLEGRILLARREADSIVGTAQDEAEALKRDVASLTATRNALKTEIASTRGELVSVREELAALQQQVTERQGVLDDVRKKIRDLVAH